MPLAKGLISQPNEPFPPYPGGPTGDTSNYPDILAVLKKGADVNMPNPKGYTVLMYAANLGLVENVKTLLANGRRPNLEVRGWWNRLVFGGARRPVVSARAAASGGECTQATFGEKAIMSGACPAPVYRARALHHASAPVDGINPLHGFRLLHRLDVEIDHHRLAVAAHQDAFQHLVRTGVDLLVRHEGRHIDEIARPRLRGELQPLAPAQSRPALDHVNNALKRSVMMRARLGIGMDVTVPAHNFARRPERR